MERVEVVLAEQRQVGLGQPEVGLPVDRQRRLGALELGRALGLGEPGVERVGDRAELHQGVQDDHVLEPGGELDRHRRPAARPPRGEPARGAVASRSSSA